VTQPSIDLGEILEQMDELGRAKFDAALERVKAIKLQARVDELEERERENHTPATMKRLSEAPVERK
jgi:hypothetical protein